METNEKNIRNGLGWAFGERLFAQFVTLLVSIVLARLLDPEHYGIISIVMVFIAILDAFVIGGFGNALVQKKDADELDFNTICVFSVSMASVLYVGLFFVAPLIESFYEMEVLALVIRIMGIRVIVSSFNSIQHAYIQRKMEFKKFFFSTLGGTIISAVVGIVMAAKGFGVWALVAQYLTNSIIDTIVLFFVIDWKPKIRFSFIRFKALFGFGSKMLIATLVNTFNDSYRSLVIGKRYSSEDLAFYNQGKKYPEFLMSNLVASVQKVFFPGLSNLQDDREKIKAFMRSSIRISSFLLLPLIIGLIAVADKFVLSVLTEKWMPCVMFLRILSLIYVTRTMNSIFQSSLLAIGNSFINMIHEIVGTILTITLVSIGAFVLDSIPFIAWSYVISMVVGTLIFVFAVRHDFKYRLREIFRDFVPYLFISSLMGVSVYFIGYIPINSWFVLCIQIVSGVFLYFGLSKLFRIKELDIFIDYVKKIKKERGQK